MPSNPAPASPAMDRARPAMLRWVRNAVLVATALSLAIHVLVLLISALIHSPAGAGGSRADTAPIELALLTDIDLPELTQAELETLEPVPQESDLEADLDLVDDSVRDVAGAETSLNDTGPQGGAGDLGTGDLEGGGGGGSAKFFGVEARGSRFAYVVDVSGSMGFGGKIESLARELRTSIDDLTETTKFVIIAYSDKGFALGGRREWTRSSRTGKRWAQRELEKLTASGGTNPGPAFELAYSMTPQPDAIYFMTDGEFDEGVVFQIHSLNLEAQAPIHCIAFGSRDGEGLLRQIARESGGTYTFVPGGAP